MTKEQVEQRKERLVLSGGVCEVCGKPLNSPYAQPQGAHLIGQGEMNVRRYGTFFINSVANIRMTCSLECNAKCDISRNPLKVLQTLADILDYEIRKFCVKGE